MTENKKLKKGIKTIEEQKFPIQKKVETIKLRFNDYIKEDIDESSLDEKNIIFIRNIKLASRKKYKGNLPIKQALRQRGKSQDNIIRKKNVKKNI